MIGFSSCYVLRNAFAPTEQATTFNKQAEDRECPEDVSTTLEDRGCAGIMCGMLRALSPHSRSVPDLKLF